MTEPIKAIDIVFRSVNETTVRLQVVAQHGDWAVCEAPFINETACCIVYVPQAKAILHTGGYTFINGRKCCEIICEVFHRYLAMPPVSADVLALAMNKASGHDLTRKVG